MPGPRARGEVLPSHHTSPSSCSESPREYSFSSLRPCFDSSGSVEHWTRAAWRRSHPTGSGSLISQPRSRSPRATGLRPQKRVEVDERAAPGPRRATARRVGLGEDPPRAQEGRSGVGTSFAADSSRSWMALGCHSGLPRRDLYTKGRAGPRVSGSPRPRQRRGGVKCQPRRAFSIPMPC